MSDSNSIAVIGMTGRFPEANNINEFWNNIKNGKECIKYFSDEELLEAGITKDQIENKDYIKAKGYLEGAGLFDANFFGYSPREAKLMDPQHRLLLELCYEILFKTKYIDLEYDKKVGVFVSSSFNTYLLNYISRNPGFLDESNYYQVTIGNSNDFLATRIAYKLGLKGPAQTIQTACSSSLVAIHYACQSLLSYECNMAVAGGVSITTPFKSGYLYKKGGIASKDGHCRPFDKDASGTVPGNGVGVVLLKRYEDALLDGDNIYAVIRGTAINNDGSNKMGYTAPSAEGQEEVIKLAQIISGVPPETIGLVEAHGTGTYLGDPIETKALINAFAGSSNKKNYCAITSTKANIGHLDSASGVAGFIKAILSVYYGYIPPSINFSSLNSEIYFSNTPFYVNSKLKNWQNNNVPRRAAVSSFGIGGTNAHVIIESYNVKYNDNIFDSLNIFNKQTYLLDSLSASFLAPVSYNSPSYSFLDNSLVDSCGKILKRLIDTDYIDYEKDFEYLGADSLMLLDYQLLLEKELGVSVSLSDIAKNNTISKLAKFIETSNSSVIKKSDLNFSSLIVEIKKGEKDSIPLFCIHPAGGVVSVFQGLANQLPNDQRVIGIKAYGWEENEIPDNDIIIMAKRYKNAIKQVQPEGPYCLCGLSMGGTVAFEISQMLKEENEKIGILALIDSPPPSMDIIKNKVPNSNEEIMEYINSMSPSVAQSLQNIYLKQGRSKNKFFDLWRCHRDIASNYRAEKYSGDILYFCAKERSKYLGNNMEHDWMQYVDGSIEIQYVDGNHLTIHLDPNVNKVAQIIKDKLFFLKFHNSNLIERNIQNNNLGVYHG